MGHEYKVVAQKKEGVRWELIWSKQYISNNISHNGPLRGPKKGGC